MKSLVQKLCLVGLALLIALPIAAQEEKKNKKNKKGAGGGPIAALKKSLEDANLTAEQQKKVDEIIAKHESAIREAAKKAGDAPRRIQEEKGKLKGEKKGKELNEAARTAAKLSAEEEKAVDELERHTQELRKEIAAVLTDEQKEKTKIGGGKGGKKNKNN